MGRRIIQQPNGNYAVFSTIVDDFILVDATIEEYIQMRIEEESKQIKKDIHKIAKKLEDGEKPYHQFTTTWDETIQHIKDIHGEGGEQFTWLRDNGLINTSG